MFQSMTSDWTFNPMRYGLFGWIETFLGVVGLAMGYASLAVYSNPGFPLSTLRIVEAVCVGIGLAILAALTVQRWFYRELFALIYGIIAIGGAICAMIVVLNHSQRPGTFFVVYFFCWAVAMGVKMFWVCCAEMGPTASFRLEEHPVLDSKIRILIPTILFCLVNIIGFAVQLSILTTTFEES